MLKVINIKYSVKDECYIASISHLELDAFGDTSHEAIVELSIAFKLWAETMSDIIKSEVELELKKIGF